MASEDRIFIFEGTDYHKWKIRLNAILAARECQEVILNEARPNDIAENLWIQKNAKAYNIIVSSVSNSILDLISANDNSWTIIQKLDNNFLAQSSACKLMAKRKLLNLRLTESTDPNTFFATFDQAVNELSQTGEVIVEEDKINYLLLALPESLSHLADVIDAVPAQDKTVTYLKSKIKLAHDKKSSNEESTLDDINQAFRISGPSRSQANGSSNRGHPSNQFYPRSQNRGNHGRSNFNSYSPNQHHHQYSNQYHPRNHSRGRSQRGYHSRRNWRGNFRTRGGQSSNWRSGNHSSNLVSHEQFDEDNSFHVDISDTVPNVANNVNVNSLKADEYRELISWLIDSGTNAHIINTAKFFYEYVYLKKPVELKVGDGFALKAEIIGNIKAQVIVNGQTVEIKITNVYYSPNMTKNLLSVSSMAKTGSTVLFNDINAKVFNRNGKLSMVASKSNNLYEIKTLVKVQPPPSRDVYANNVEMTNLEKWHRTLGHINFRDLKDLKNYDLMDGLPKNFEKDFLKCEICLENKMSNLKFNNNRSRASEVLEIIHTDVNGPINQIGHNGEKYFVSCIDDYSKFSSVYCVKSKAEVPQKIMDFVAFAENYQNKNVKTIRCDNGKEYINNKLVNFTKEKGIHLAPCPPYTHSLNGTAERFNRTIMNKARCLRQEANLPISYWPECVKTANYLINRSLANTKVLKTPYELFFNKKPNVTNLRLYGSVAYVRTPEQKRHSKFAPKAQKGILVGYTDQGYRILLNNKIIVSRNVQFIERDCTSIKAKCKCTTSRNSDESSKQERFVTFPQDENPVQELNQNEDNPQFLTPNASPNSQNTSTSSSSENVPQPVRTLRDRSTLRPPRRLVDSFIFINYCDANAPMTYQEAISTENANQWKLAMNDEIQSLETNETWDVVDRPENKKVIDLKWLYKVKPNNQFKARLVAKGFQQEYSEDEEIYSPVLRMCTLRILLVLACFFQWSIFQMDVKTAFLNGKLDKEVYVNPPEGFNLGTNKVFKLKKALYGLRESSRSWYECFNDYITQIGFSRSNYDYCLFSMHVNETVIYILLYVDDLLILSKNQSLIKNVRTQLSNRFRMTDVGLIKNYLGLEIDYNPANSKVSISQENYILSLAEKFQIKDSKPYQTPMESNLKLLPAENDEMSPNLPFRNLIGALLYLANGSRPDISFSVNYLSRYQNSYSKTHFKYALRVLQYLYSTRSLKLHYNVNHTEALKAYVDADWASDLVDRKSTTGIVIKLFDNPILWKTQKQKIVSRASTHAEYYALADCVTEVLPIQGLLNELKIECKPTTIYEDNIGAIALGNNGKFTKNSKHIDISEHFVCDYVKKDIVKIDKISSNDQVADIFTKPLGKTQFLKLRSLLNLK